MFIEILQFILYSIIIVLVSKYWLVKVLRKIGELLKLNPKTIGNISGIATSIPELLTVSFSALTGLIGTSAYNIISSNVINLVQYIASVILSKNQKELKNQSIQVDLWLVILTILIPVIIIIINIENNITIVPILIILLFVFFKITNNAHNLYMKKEKMQKEVINEKENRNSRITVENYTKKEVTAVVIQGILLAGVGVLLYIIGNLLSSVLDNLCRNFNVPEIILGVLLGFITSIPELITFVESQRHHENDKEGVIEATGNLITSNIMNLCIIQSIGIIIYHIFS